jgi:hypothetical protein
MQPRLGPRLNNHIVSLGMPLSAIGEIKKTLKVK